MYYEPCPRETNKLTFSMCISDLGRCVFVIQKICGNDSVTVFI